MKDKKMYILLVISILFAVIGVSLAFFTLNIIGNDTAKGNKVVTGNLELTYTDTNEISLENAFPGDSFTKEVSVKNTGTLDAKYNLVWQSLTNTITNDELLIEATCKRLNSSGTEDGTCESISQKAVSSNIIKSRISIETGITHVYTVKVTFIDTGEPQNYNKNKSFSGKLGIEEYTPTQFEKDTWATIVANVKANNISNYNVGDVKEVDLGSTYGTHTLRVANTSTPSECSTEGFSQSACGFVLEFADIITTHKMNDTATNVDGWPATSMRTFVNNDIYNSLPTDLKNAIIDTTVISGYGKSDTKNFISTDKLYLLSPAEIWSERNEYDTSNNCTKQLDYYKSLNTDTVNKSPAVKNNGSNVDWWWLRSAHSTNDNNFFNVDPLGGSINLDSASYGYGVSPAFRIG